MSKTRARKKTTKRKPVILSVSGYRSTYEGNPIVGALDELAAEGKLSGTSVDDRKYIADLLVDKLADKVCATGLGAAIIRRITTWLKGSFRDDVLSAISAKVNGIQEEIQKLK